MLIKPKTDKIVRHINNALIDLINIINRKEIPENENRDKVFDIVEEVLNFVKQQKGKGFLSGLAHVAKVFGRMGLKIFTSKQMLKRLPIAIAPVQAGNASENLLNEI